MNLHTALPVMGLLLLAAPTAQAIPALEIGSRVRVGIVREIPGRDAVIRRIVERTGLFAALDSTGLALMGVRGQPDLDVPLAAVEEMFVSRGRDAGRGVLNGLALGALAGFAGTVVVDAIGNESVAADDRMDGTVYVAVIGATALLGGALGALHGAEAWDEYPVRQLWQRASASP